MTEELASFGKPSFWHARIAPIVAWFPNTPYDFEPGIDRAVMAHAQRSLGIILAKERRVTPTGFEPMLPR